MNRYVMSYSQADACNLIVYADSYEEAQMKFENGEYTLEDEESKEFDTMPDDRTVEVDWDTDGESLEECGLPEDVSIPWYIHDEGVADYCSDIYGFCVNSWVEVNENE